MAKIPAISFSSLTQPASGTVIVLAGAKGKLGKTGAALDKVLDGALSRAMKAADFKGAYGKTVAVWGPGKFTRVAVLGAHKDDKKNGGKPGAADWLNLGGKAMGAIAGAKGTVTVLLEKPGAGREDVGAEDAADFALGMKLRAYRFDKYFTKDKGNGDGKDAKKRKNGSDISKISVCVAGNARASRAYGTRERISGGVLLARDLVNEPANELGPLQFAAKAKELTRLGVKVEALTEKEMAAKGMRALLGVAQGSVRPPRLVVMRWNGAKNTREAPVAFIGKGVVFDTGGISIKSAGGMEDMKGDMAGAACVTGLMHALAARKAKVNAVGVLGLVENMPDGKAQRPGDIVKSMSGQTIEIINTDAEGRLVLADALWYTQDRFKPRFMINLATLTGAVIVALGKHYAGLFSNNDDLAARLVKAGEATAERVWRLPLGEEYDKAINSRFADMKNTGGRDAGSITAAQFLQRFVNGVPWAHLDIAGTGMAAPSSDISTGWAPGFGVRLLDRLVADHYEK